MNCLEFRRRLETAPAEVDETMRGHADECPSCQAFRRRIALLDGRLDAALRVPVPENLEARIVLRQSFPPRRSWARRLRAAPALAASLVVLALAALLGGVYLHDEAELGGELVSLVEAAEYALAAPGPVAAPSVAEALRPVGLGLGADVGRVSFAGRCIVRGNLSGHLVLRGAAGEPVTVFLMPDERLLRRARFSGHGWAGVLLPGGDGAVGIVAPEGHPVEPVVERVLAAVRWRV